MTSRFDRDTAVTAVGDGVYEGHVDRGWWIVAGPNGGFIAAVLVRAMEQAVGDPERGARSLTVHYTRRPVEGPVRVVTRLERVGRSLTTVTARMVQEEREVALAIAAFSREREGLAFDHARMPEVPPPEACTPWDRDAPLEIHGRYEMRWAIGSPAWDSGEGRCGGWIRLREPPRAQDAALLAAYSDAWPPAVFGIAGPEQIGAVPTVDLTVHFRSPPPVDPASFVLVVFRSRLAHGGFVEEDGELWSPNGRLLAHSRQLAVLA